ncbi:MAG: MYXO-CTERM sorting domain-containing protein [Pseudomonadota bacterium]
MKNGPRGMSGFLWSSAAAALVAGLVVCGCGDTPSADGVDVIDGSLTGELALFVADDFNGRTETKYVLRQRNGNERALIFDSDPQLRAGTTVKVWGTEAADGVRVVSWRTLAPPAPEPLATAAAALKAGDSFALRRLAFVVVDVGGGVTVTQQQAQDELTGPVVNANDPPLRNYYIEASYGTQDLDGRAFQLSYPMSTCGSTDPSGMSKALKPMVDTMGGGKFNHYLWYFSTKISACAWSGLGEVGTPAAPTDDTWYNASRSCVVMVQEPGHNFGMQHSSSMDCGTAIFPDTPQGTCTHSEYGDRYDPMGGACDHMNGWQKAYNGWLQGCNVVRARSSGTFKLVPIELPCDGVQLLQIPMPKMRPFTRSGGGGQMTTEQLTHYYLELRTNRGLDMGTTVSVQVRVSGDTLGRNQRAVHTWILDMNPATATFDGMAAGGTFSDPAGGVKFDVTELDAEHATVVVTMDADGGGPVCLDKTTAFTAPGPGIESCNATPAVPGAAVGGMGGSTGGALGTGGVLGTGGRGGAAGTGGRPATGGAGGSMAGTGGAGGRPGTGGASALGGAPATGGTRPIGTGGADPGSGGAPVGSGGAGPIGTGGSVDSGVGAGGGVITGGCGCAAGSGSSPRGGLLALAAMALLGSGRARRRR